MFPWPVTMVVKFCVRCIFACSLSATFVKYSFLIIPLLWVENCDLLECLIELRTEGFFLFGYRD